MSALWRRWMIAFAGRLVRRYGLCIARATPVGLLPSRVEAIRQRIAQSGHLGHRFHVRRNLETDLAALERQVERMAP